MKIGNSPPKILVRDRPPRVLLVTPFFPYPAGRNISPPLNMALIGAAFREKGCDVKIVDASARLVEDGEARILTAIEEMAPDIMAMTLIVGNTKHAYKLAGKIISKTKIPVIAGGPHATILPEEALDNGIHIVVRGEGEATVGELVEWMSGSRELASIDGISYRDMDGKTICNPDRALISDLDTVPLPAHDLFDERDYFETDADKTRAGKIISSRGCPNRCSFCSNPVFGSKFRYRSAKSVISEMELLKDHYGIDRFEFVDDSFTANRDRLMKLTSSLRKIPDVTFTCVTRLENLDDETVPALRAAGLSRAYIGVESANPETLRRIHKNINLDKLEPTLRLLRKNGIEVALFFMFGFPWESASDMQKTNRLIEKLRPLTTWYNEGSVLTPYPGTDIYEQYHKSVGFTQWWLKDWLSPTGKPLHFMQRRYYFPYDEDQLLAMKQGLQIIFDHNRGEQSEIEKLKQNWMGVLNEIERHKKVIDELQSDINGLHELIQERDRQLHEIWNRSTIQRIKKLWESLTRR